MLERKAANWKNVSLPESKSVPGKPVVQQEL
jgi:hypothetical protein